MGNATANLAGAAIKNPVPPIDPIIDNAVPDPPINSMPPIPNAPSDNKTPVTRVEIDATAAIGNE